jgi:hypothetical protein
MHREGFDPENVQVEDLLCDFCEKTAWAQNIPCVEGHHGSLICGDCLTAAWIELVDTGGGQPIGTCCLCLQKSDDSGYVGCREQGRACRVCVKRSAGVLHKSSDWAWRKPDTDVTESPDCP